MTITVNDKSKSSAAASGSVTWSHTVTSGSNKILIVVLAGEQSGLSSTPPDWSGVTFNSVAMTLARTQLATETTTTFCRVSIYYLINPAETTANIVATDSGAGSGFARCASMACTLRDAAQQAPEVVNGNGTTSDGTTLNQSITTLTNNALIISGFATNIENSQTSGQTLEDTSADINAGTGIRGSYSSFEQATAGAKTMDWTSSATFGRAVMANASFAPPAGDGISLTDITDKRIFQRTVGGSTGNVPVAGTYTGTAPTTVEAKVTNQDGSTVLDWTTLTGATIGGGNISGTIPSVPQGGGRNSSAGYHVQIRSKDSGGTVIATSSAGSNWWGVGKLFGVCGSSTPEKWFTNTTAEAADNRLSKYNESGWAACTGDGAIAFGNQAITDEPSVPVGLLDYGIGGTTLASQWESAAYSGYTDFTTGITQVGGSLEGIVIHVGSNDCRASTIVSQADHETKYRSFCTNIRTSTSQSTLPIIISGCQRSPTGTGTDLDWAWGRAAEQNVADDSNNMLGATVVDLPLDVDNIHLTTGQTGGTAVSARRCARAYKSRILGVGTYKGPRATALTYDSVSGWARVVFEVAPGSSLVGRTGQTALTGIVFKAGGVEQTPDVEPYVSSYRTVSAQLPTGLSTVTVEIMYGATPTVTNDLFANA